MDTATATYLVSHLAIASVEFLILGLIVAILLFICHSVSPSWRRRIWLLAILKPVATVLTGFVGGRIALPAIMSDSLLESVMFPGLGPDGKIVVDGGGATMQILAWIWVVVACVLLVRVWCQYVAGRQFVAESLEKGYMLKASALRRLDPNLYIPPDARVIATYEDRGPVTVGARHPAVILPESLLPWITAHRDPTRAERDRFGQVLRHEVAHIQHRDYGLSLLANVLLSFFWFHPMAHWSYRRFRINSELCCDESVVASGVDPQLYVDTLMRLVADGVARKGLALRMVGDYGPANVLRHRLHFMLSDWKKVRRGRRQLASYCLMVLLLLAMPRFLTEGPGAMVDILYADGVVKKMPATEYMRLVEAGLMPADAKVIFENGDRFATQFPSLRLASGALDNESGADGPALASGASAADLPPADGDSAGGTGLAGVPEGGEVLAQIDETAEAAEGADDGKPGKKSSSEHGWYHGVDVDPKQPDSPILPRREAQPPDGD